MPKAARDRAPHTSKSLPSMKRTTRTSAKAMQETNPEDIEVSPSLTLVELEAETEKTQMRRSARLNRPEEESISSRPSSASPTKKAPKQPKRKLRSGNEAVSRPSRKQQQSQDTMDVDMPDASPSSPPIASVPAPECSDSSASTGALRVKLRLSPKPAAVTEIHDVLETRPDSDSESHHAPSSTQSTPRTKRIKLIVRSPVSIVLPSSGGKGMLPPFTELPDKQWPPAPSHPTPPPRPAHPNGQGPQPHNNADGSRSHVRSGSIASYASSSGSASVDDTPLPTPESQPVSLPGQNDGKGRGKGKGKGKGKNWDAGYFAGHGYEGEVMDMDIVEDLIGEDLEHEGQGAEDESVEQLCALCKGWREYLRTYGDEFGKKIPTIDGESTSRTPSPVARRLVLAMSDECESCRLRQSRKKQFMDVDDGSDSTASPLHSPSFFFPTVPPSSPVMPSPFLSSTVSDVDAAACSSSDVFALYKTAAYSEHSYDYEYGSDDEDDEEDEFGGLQYLPLEIFDPYGELAGKKAVDADAKVARGAWEYKLVSSADDAEGQVTYGDDDDEMTGLGLHINEVAVVI